MSTVLLIPGLLSDHAVWEPVLAHIDAQVADLSTQSSLTDMARDCLEHHPGPLRIAGHSMGGRVAMEITRLAPERVERLALLDTGIHPLGPGERERRSEIIEFAHAWGMRRLAERWIPPMLGPAQQDNPELMEALTAMVLRMDPDLHERQITALVNRPDAAAGLLAARCPVLLVVGRQDQWSPVAQHEEMQALVPQARLEIIGHAGHFAPVEQPDAVAEVLADFLSDTGG